VFQIALLPSGDRVANKCGQYCPDVDTAPVVDVPLAEVPLSENVLPVKT